MYHGHAQSHCIGFFNERSGHRGPTPLLGTWLGIYGDHGRRDPPYGAIAFADEA